MGCRCSTFPMQGLLQTLVWKEYFNPYSRQNPTACLEIIEELNAAGFYRFQSRRFLKMYKTEHAASEWDLYDCQAGEQTLCYVNKTCDFYSTKLLAEAFQVHRKHMVIDLVCQFTGLKIDDSDML